ncbi:MAG TPA: YdcF family protein, partial [Caldilineaceae bacterium]|nr:YdcF family protein [Caldilineaceae bacterium]
AIVVMGGEGVRFMRTRHAVQLYAAGLAPRVVFSGGDLAGVGIACTSTELSVEAATSFGLPEEAIVLAPEAQSTLDEAANLQGLAAEQGWRSLLLVTDRFHTRRSLQTVRAYLPDVAIQVSAPDDPVYDPARWWRNERSLVLAVNEALKLGLYWLEYGISPIG